MSAITYKEIYTFGKILSAKYQPFCLAPGVLFTGMDTSKYNHMSNKVWDEMTYPFPNFNLSFPKLQRLHCWSLYGNR